MLGPDYKRTGRKQERQWFPTRLQQVMSQQVVTGVCKVHKYLVACLTGDRDTCCVIAVSEILCTPTRFRQCTEEISQCLFMVYTLPIFADAQGLSRSTERVGGMRNSCNAQVKIFLVTITRRETTYLDHLIRHPSQTLFNYKQLTCETTDVAKRLSPHFKSNKKYELSYKGQKGRCPKNIRRHKTVNNDKCRKWTVIAVKL